MTIESNGQAYTFEGFLNNTEIEYQHDDIYGNHFWGSEVAFRRSPTRANVTLEIIATGPITRALIPQKGKGNVQ